MKLLIATPLYPPDIGGPATYTKLLERELPSRGFSVHVVSFSGVRRLPKIIRHLVYLYRLLRAGRKADALYALDPVSVGLPTLITARILRKRFFLRVAGDYAWEQGVQRFGVLDLLDDFVKKDRYGFPVTILKSVQSLVASRAERVIVPSKYFRGIVAAWGVPMSRILVVPSVIENIPNQGDKRELRKFMQFPGEFVLTVGRLVPWKGFDLLIHSLPKLVKKFRHLKLVIVGSGPDMGRLERLVEDLSLSSHVALAGALPRDILFKYIRAADLFVLNSSYEGLSHQILEVMAIGTPVVATDVGGNPEAITDGVEGLLVPYGDEDALVSAVSKMLSEEATRAGCATRAQNRVRSLSAPKMADALVKTFA